MTAAAAGSSRQLVRAVGRANTTFYFILIILLLEPTIMKQIGGQK